jgi:tRNA-splicing endonuclease subunit Sen15, fungi type
VGEPNKWRITQPKRVVMAILDDDSTVVYYIVHDGVVKPRQN